MSPRHRVVITPWLARPMRLLLPNWSAITLGHAIFAAAPLSDELLAHELVHVRQWKEHGFLFAFRYSWASVTAWRGGGHWYRDNRYEVLARGEDTA